MNFINGLDGKIPRKYPKNSNTAPKLLKIVKKKSNFGPRSTLANISAPHPQCLSTHDIYDDLC